MSVTRGQLLAETKGGSHPEISLADEPVCLRLFVHLYICTCVKNHCGTTNNDRIEVSFQLRLVPHCFHVPRCTEDPISIGRKAHKGFGSLLNTWVSSQKGRHSQNCLEGTCPADLACE